MLPGSGRFFDGLTVALSQASEGKWYVSTLELRLASFEVSAACRHTRASSVIVDENMPRTLWSDDDDNGHATKAENRRRLPPVRAVGVVWKLPVDMLGLALRDAVLLRGVESIQVTGTDRGYSYIAYNQSVGGSSRDAGQSLTGVVHTAQALFENMRHYLDLQDAVHDKYQALSRVPWPPGLRQLCYGRGDHEQINWHMLPSSLERLVLGGGFNQPIEPRALPASLRRLTLGNHFDHSIADVV